MAIEVTISRESPPEVPRGLRIPDFLAKINSLGGPAKSCRFAVRINIRQQKPSADNLLNRLPYRDRLRDLVYVCDSVEFPGRGFGVNNIRYYGAGQVVPNNVEYGPCNLSIICNNIGLERQFFDDWQEIINPTNTFNFNYPSQYYCDVEIFQFSEYGEGAGSFAPGQALPFGSVMGSNPQVIYWWKLHKCWPTFVNPQQVTWADNSDILRLQVSLAYKYWDRPSKNVYYTPQVTSDTPIASQMLTSYIAN